MPEFSQKFAHFTHRMYRKESQNSLESLLASEELEQLRNTETSTEKQQTVNSEQETQQEEKKQEKEDGRQKTGDRRRKEGGLGRERGGGASGQGVPEGQSKTTGTFAQKILRRRLLPAPQTQVHWPNGNPKFRDI